MFVTYVFLYGACGVYFRHNDGSIWPSFIRNSSTAIKNAQTQRFNLHFIICSTLPFQSYLITSASTCFLAMQVKNLGRFWSYLMPFKTPFLLKIIKMVLH